MEHKQMDKNINALVPSWIKNQGPWTYAFESTQRPKSMAYEMLNRMHTWMLEPSHEPDGISTM